MIAWQVKGKNVLVVGGGEVCPQYCSTIARPSQYPPSHNAGSIATGKGVQTWYLASFVANDDHSSRLQQDAFSML